MSLDVMKIEIDFDLLPCTKHQKFNLSSRLIVMILLMNRTSAQTHVENYRNHFASVNCMVVTHSFIMKIMLKPMLALVPSIASFRLLHIGRAL